MPIIGGVKMACTPCIRGHRSTKCQHSGERVLVPVRKPGRPLSVCPHPTDKACGCGVVTAAIPRSKKCGCGTPASNGDDKSSPSVKPEPVELLAEKSPTSPIKRHFSIQKSTPKQVTKIDAALLERTDPAYVNVRLPPSWNDVGPIPNGAFALSIPPPGSPMSFTPPVTNGMMNGFHQPIPAPGLHLNGGISHPEQVHYMMTTASTSTMIAPGMISVANNGPSNHNGHQRNGSIGVVSPVTTSTEVSSCCASKAATPAPTAQITAVKSCCGGTAKSATLPATNGHVEKGDTVYTTVGEDFVQTNGHTHGPLMAQVNPSAIQHSPEMHSYGQSHHPEMMFPPGFYQPPGAVIYSYPASYGTMQSPLLPEQWRQIAMSTQPNPNYTAGIPNQHTLAQPQPAVPYYIDNSNVDGGVSHACSCGSSCNCVGCPAHPYNEATQGMVRSAMDSMLNLDTGSTNHNGSAAGTNNGGEASGTAPSSPTPAHTPSDASGLTEEQSQVAASNFFFVAYPDMGCGGVEHMCPCGDDCQCLGCSIHNNTTDDYAGAVEA